MPEITSYLKQFRSKKGWTQEELAERLGVTRQTINAIEQGKYQPTLHLASRCARLFSTTIETLFKFKD